MTQGIQVWGTDADLAINRTGQMSAQQISRARRSALALPVIAGVLGAVLWCGSWLAFRTHENVVLIVVVLGALVWFPVGVLLRVGAASKKAAVERTALEAFGLAKRVPVSNRYASRVDVRIGSAVLPLLPAWANAFVDGETYEVYYSPADRNILSGVHYPAS